MFSLAAFLVSCSEMQTPTSNKNCQDALSVLQTSENNFNGIDSSKARHARDSFNSVCSEILEQTEFQRELKLAGLFLNFNWAEFSELEKEQHPTDFTQRMNILKSIQPNIRETSYSVFDMIPDDHNRRHDHPRRENHHIDIIPIVFIGGDNHPHDHRHNDFSHGIGDPHHHDDQVKNDEDCCNCCQNVCTPCFNGVNQGADWLCGACGAAENEVRDGAEGASNWCCRVGSTAGETIGNEAEHGTSFFRGLCNRVGTEAVAGAEAVDVGGAAEAVRAQTCCCFQVVQGEVVEQAAGCGNNLQGCCIFIGTNIGNAGQEIVNAAQSLPFNECIGCLRENGGAVVDVVRQIPVGECIGCLRENGGAALDLVRQIPVEDCLRTTRDIVECLISLIPSD
jgi:hypothetical protein